MLTSVCMANTTAYRPTLYNMYYVVGISRNHESHRHKHLPTYVIAYVDNGVHICDAPLD